MHPEAIENVLLSEKEVELHSVSVRLQTYVQQIKKVDLTSILPHHYDSRSSISLIFSLITTNLPPKHPTSKICGLL